MIEKLSGMVSVRVLPAELAEFEALCAEVGVERSRVLRQFFADGVVGLRAQANKRRTLHSLAEWESEWQSEWQSRGEKEQ